MTIHSKPATPKYRDNWEQTFGAKTIVPVGLSLRVERATPESPRLLCKCGYNNYLPRKYCTVCGVELPLNKEK